MTKTEAIAAIRRYQTENCRLVDIPAKKLAWTITRNTFVEEAIKRVELGGDNPKRTLVLFHRQVDGLRILRDSEKSSPISDFWSVGSLTIHNLIGVVE